MIELKDISFSNILSDINLSIPDGSYIGIAGPNGSGKSALARVVKGIEDPTGGAIYIDGALRPVRTVTRDIGLVLSSPENQLVSSSIEEDAAFGLENMNLPSQEIARRTEETLKWGGLWKLGDVPAHHLSAGQQQMLVFAGIIAMRPRYLIIDEATSMIDLEGKALVLDAIKRMREAKVGIIHISHDLDELLEAQDIYILDKGHVVWKGPPSRLHHQESLLTTLDMELPPLLKLKSLMVRGGYPIDDNAMDTERMAEEIIRIVNQQRS